MKTSLREQAIKLRTQGWSYNIIKQRLNVSKSTLSHWLRYTPYTPNQTVLHRIRTNVAKSNEVRHQKKLGSITEAMKLGKKEVGTLSQRDLFMLGLGIYIGEGTKLYEETRVINANPNVIRLAMIWFREICGAKLENFAMTIHIYPDTSERVALSYWSKLTGIPLSQFSKTQIDLRKNKSNQKRRMLPYGTAHLKIKACGKAEFGVLLHRRIVGWIEAVYQQNAGIV